MFVLDSHCDTPSQIIRLRDLSLDNHHSHVDFPKLRAGGVDAAFFALYTSKTMAPDAATRYALQMIAGINDAIAANPDKVAHAMETEDIIRNKEKGLTSILIGMENGSPIQDSLPLLRLFHKLGVRYMTLSHNGDNLICDAAAQGTTWHGLSPFGKEVVAEMNRIGMIVDIAHASDETFYDCLKYSKAPIVSTHSCCRDLAHHRRNLTDQMLRDLASEGGVCQINFYPIFLSDEFNKVLDASGLDPKSEEIEDEFIKDPGNPAKVAAWHAVLDELEALERPSYKVVVDHIEHAIEVAGIDHVGIGSDFDGINVTPSGLENVSKIGIIFKEMSRRGFSEEEISKVAGGNFMRIMDVTKKLSI